MDYDRLKEQLRLLTEERIEEVLRSRRPSLVTETHLTPSAVVIPIFRRSEGWCAIFTKRSQEVNAHKGEISFPGGVLEPGESALGAALRELEEELGIRKESLRLLGELDEILTITGFRIRPFVACVDWPVALSLSRGEIEEIFILSLNHFLDPARLKIKHWQRKDQDYPVYYFEFPECTVWGATAKIVKNFLERLTGAEIA